MNCPAVPAKRGAEHGLGAPGTRQGPMEPLLGSGISHGFSLHVFHSLDVLKIFHISIPPAAGWQGRGGADSVLRALPATKGKGQNGKGASVLGAFSVQSRIF